MLTIRCPCGEVFHGEEPHVGPAIKCWRSGHVLSIGDTPPATSPHSSVESPRPPGAPIVSGRWKRGRWVVAGVVSVVVLIAGVAFLSLPDRNEHRVNPSPALRPTEVPKPIPAPSPSAPVARSLESDESTAKPPVTRLKTGTDIYPPLGPSGHSVLRVTNGMRYDATLTLIDSDTGTVRRFVYLRAREMMTLAAIGPCRCRLFFALGTDWDALEEEFREDSSFSVFDDPLRFSESAGYATEFSITLHPVPGGTAKTTPLSKEEFQRQLGKR